MNWAWQQKPSPTLKLVLMALSDAANDYGICWPSVSTVATKCCVSGRTVRRVMQKLVEGGLLLSEQRYRKDGSCSSNRYRLQLEGGDNLTLAHDFRDTTPGQPEGRPNHSNAVGVTGNRLAHRLPRESGRVTTQRSAVVTRAAILLTARACDWILRLQRDFVFLYCALNRF